MADNSRRRQRRGAPRCRDHQPAGCM